MHTFSEAEIKFLEADYLIKAGDFRKGISVLEEIIEAQPDFGPAYNHIGWILLVHFSDLKRAAEYFEKAIAVSPTYPNTYPNYALVLNTLKRYDELQKVVEQALMVENVEVSALYYELATMYEVQRNFDKAVKYFQLAIENTLDQSDLTIYVEGLERITTKRNYL